jgi:hypothetical protein
MTETRTDHEPRAEIRATRSVRVNARRIGIALAVSIAGSPWAASPRWRAS